MYLPGTKPSWKVLFSPEEAGPLIIQTWNLPLTSSKRKKLEKIRTETGQLGAKQAQWCANAYFFLKKVTAEFSSFEASGSETIPGTKELVIS